MKTGRLVLMVSLDIEINLFEFIATLKMSKSYNVFKRRFYIYENIICFDFIVA